MPNFLNIRTLLLALMKGTPIQHEVWKPHQYIKLTPDSDRLITENGHAYELASWLDLFQFPQDWKIFSELTLQKPQAAISICGESGKNDTSTTV